MHKHFSNKFPYDPSKDVIVNARHSELLKKAHERLTHAKSLLESNEGVEIILQELNHCRSHVDEIIGSKTNDDVLDLLFNQFCIGK